MNDRTSQDWIDKAERRRTPASGAKTHRARGFHAGRSRQVKGERATDEK